VTQRRCSGWQQQPVVSRLLMSPGHARPHIVVLGPGFAAPTAIQALRRVVSSLKQAPHEVEPNAKLVAVTSN
jgi:hypothetical protein